MDNGYSAPEITEVGSVRELTLNPGKGKGKGQSNGKGNGKGNGKPGGYDEFS
jgi:hypothetical protein